jgi:hypothetical protein
MKTFIFTALLTATFASAPSVFAGEHAHHSPAKPATAEKADDPAFTKLDSNKDGFIKKSELPAKHPLLPHFSMVDKNKDGKLDKKEFEAAQSML